MNASVVIIISFALDLLKHVMWELRITNWISHTNLIMTIQWLILRTFNYMWRQFLNTFLNLSFVIIKVFKFLIIIIFLNASLLHKVTVNPGVRALAEFDSLHSTQGMELFYAIDATMLLFQHRHVIFFIRYLILVRNIIQWTLQHFISITDNRQ